MRQMINRGQTSYDPNRLGGGDPRQATVAATGRAAKFLQSTRVGASIAAQDPAVVTGDGPAKQVAAAFVYAISQHRNWAREPNTLPNG